MSWVATAVIGGAVVGAGASIYGADKSANALSSSSKDASKSELEMYYKSREDAAPWREAGQNALNTLFGGQTVYQGTEPNKLDYITTGDSHSLDYLRDLRTLQGLKAQRDNGANVDVDTAENDFITKYINTGELTFDNAAYNKAHQDYLASGAKAEGMVQKGPGEFIPSEQPGYQYGYKEFVEKPLLRRDAARGGLGGGGMAKELTRYASDYASTKYDDFLNRWYQSLTPYQSAANIGQTTAMQTGQNAMATGQMVGQNALIQGQAQANKYNQIGSTVGQVASGLGQNALDMYYMNKYLQPNTGGGSSKQIT